MDLEEWEFLPDSKSFLEFGHGSGKELFKDLCFDDKMFLEMDYFICPTHSPRPLITVQGDSTCNCVSKEVVLSPVSSDEELEKEFKDIGVVTPPPPPVIFSNQDAISQVFFEKMKENEFVDMKISSPRSKSSRGMIMPHIEPDPIPLEEQEEDKVYKDDGEEHKPLKDMTFEEEEKKKESDLIVSEVKNKPCLKEISISIWRWKLTGVGALCSIGVAAAATICISVLGGHHQKHQNHHQQQQKMQFQIYTQDKRFKDAVQQATRLNQALSAVRGAPMTRAHISFGGCYDGF